jgi:cytochrome oxidase assembly protein ShyY1
MIHHLDYAAQWFVMGLIALGIWVWHGVRRGREDV